MPAIKMKRKTKRTNEAATMIGVWVPTDLLTQLDAAVRENDSDRSKLIRKAVKQLLARSS